MKKLVVWLLFVLSIGICGCLRDEVVITESENIIQNENENENDNDNDNDNDSIYIPIDERCATAFQNCERYYNNLGIGGKWTFFYFKNDPSKFVSEFTNTNGGVANLLDSCIDSLCNSFNLELKSDTTFTMDWNVITASDPLGTYQKSLSGTYYICWCFRLSGGNHPGWWYGNINFIAENGEELIAEFERSLDNYPMKFNMETNEGLFELRLQK